MRKVTFDSLKPGMKLRRPLYDSTGNILLEAGITLTRSYIRSLSKYKHGFAFIDKDNEVRSANEVIPEKTRLKALSRVDKIFVQANSDGNFILDTGEITEPVGEMIDQLLQNKFAVDILEHSLDNYTLYHSINVCILAIMTGINMGYDKEKLALLGMGGILHDLGKVKVPDLILNKQGSLTPEEYEEIKKHPSYGYDIISRTVGIENLSAIIAYQHHERFDGTGYPEGKSGEEIHDFSMIIGISDMYDALTANRVYRKAYQPYEAYEMLAGSGNYMFKHKIVQSFLYNIAAYPAGSMVKLNTGEIAEVIDTPKGYSLFPEVRVLIGQDGQRLEEPYEYKLFKMNNFTVIKVFSKKEYKDLELHGKKQ